jgi:hypothetical protein
MVAMIKMNWNTMGSEGGKKLLELKGRAYFVELGKKGAKEFYRLYSWKAVPLGGWALVRKLDNKIIKVLNVRPF